MGFPASLTTIVLTADFRTLVGGTALEADVRISSPSPLVSTTDNMIVPRANVWARTTGGLLAVTLPATDDPQWLPNGWDYLVRADFDNGIKMAWLIKLASASPAGKCDLAGFGVEVPYPQSPGPFTVLYPPGAVVSVNSRSGAVVLAKADVGLSLVDNTADAAKPVSAAQAAANALRLLAASNLSDVASPVAARANLAAAPTAAPTFTGTATFAQRQVSTPTVLADAPTVATDAALGNYFRLTLTATPRVLGAPTNPVDGQKAIWEITQDATGSRLLTLATGAGGFGFGADITALSISTAPNAIDLIGAVYHATRNRWLVIAFVRGY